ncbi:MAG TPA: hypothetical protein VGF48_09710 [Thermoanaerobaculia bacterium]|jgi:predicted esterase
MRRLVLTLLLATSALAEENAQEKGKLVENVAATRDGTQTYTLYLPTSYDATKKHPVLVVMDPRGRGTVAAAIFREAAEEFGWILISSNQTRSDGDWEPNMKALRALMPEVAERYATDPKRVYAAGFSGTAMVSWQLGLVTGGLAGVIGVGGRNLPEFPPQKFNFAHYGFAGFADFNNRDMRALESILMTENKVAHRFSQFEGGHQWIGPDEARHALGWFELLAMKNGTRPRDEALIARIWEREQARVLSGVELLEERRALLRTFDGLRDVAALRQQVSQLENDPAIAREREEIARWDAWEREFVDTTFSRTPQIFAAIRGQRLSPTATLLKEYRVAELKKRAMKPGAEGMAARRLLEAVFGQVNFYLPTQLMEKKEYALAAGVIAVATELHGDRPNVWINLAAAQARNGDKKKALASLEKAMALGWTNVEMLRKNDDFASIRDDPRFP